MPRATATDPTGAHPGRIIRVTPNRLDPRTVAAVAFQAGFRGQALVEAVAVSFAENGAHDATVQHLNTDGSVDTGLWQINSVHGIPIRDLFDPQRNANAAWAISSHGKNWTPWSTYPLRTAAQLPSAQATIASLNRSGGAVTWLQNNPIDSTARGGILSPGIGTQLERSSPWQAVAGFLGAVTSESTWLRIGKGIAGAALVVIAILLMVKKSGLAPKAVPVPV